MWNRTDLSEEWSKLFLIYILCLKKLNGDLPIWKNRPHTVHGPFEITSYAVMFLWLEGWTLTLCQNVSEYFTLQGAFELKTASQRPITPELWWKAKFLRFQLFVAILRWLIRTNQLVQITWFKRAAEKKSKATQLEPCSALTERKSYGRYYLIKIGKKLQLCVNLFSTFCLKGKSFPLLPSMYSQ